jgi:hypothetical protein
MSDVIPTYQRLFGTPDCCMYASISLLRLIVAAFTELVLPYLPSPAAPTRVRHKLEF